MVCTVVLAAALDQVVEVFRVSELFAKAKTVMVLLAQPFVRVLFKVPVLAAAFG